MCSSRTPLLACLLGVGLLLTGPRPAPADTIDFEDLTLAPDSFYNGSDGAGGFTSRGAFFNNSYNAMFGAWSGWSYSNKRDVMTPGFGNQYSAYNLPDGGGDGTSNYGVAYTFTPGDAQIVLPPGTHPESVRITNTTYAALSMRDGDMFAKKFGGPDGTDPDFFLLTISGYDGAGTLTGTVDFYLADYRFGDPSLDYIVSTWTTVDLTPLGEAARTLSFGLTSSDNDPVFGMNTPAFFALDNLIVTSNPEPGSLILAGVGIAVLLAVRRRRQRVV
jgi:hypothetical protein